MTIARNQERKSGIPYSGMEEILEISVDPSKSLTSSPKQIEIFTPWTYEGDTYYNNQRVIRGNVGWRTNGIILEIVKDGKVVRTWCDNGSSKGRSTIEYFFRKC